MLLIFNTDKYLKLLCMTTEVGDL